MTYQVGDLLQSIHHHDDKPCIIREVTEIRQYKAGTGKYKKVNAYSISSIDEPHFTFIVSEDQMPTRFVLLEVPDVILS